MIDYWFWSVAVATVAVVALSKSGLLGSLGMIGVPVLSLVMPAREAAGMLLPVLCLMDVVGLIAFRREADWRVLRVMLIGGVSGTLAGWILWSVITDAEVLLVVGVVTLLFSLDAMIPWRRWLLAHQHGAATQPSVPKGLFWGATAGVTSFISHTGGPPAQVYLLPLQLPPATYSGTTVVFFAALNFAKLVPYYFLGQLSVANLETAALLAAPAVAFMLLGVFLVRRISAKLFYQVAYALIFLVSVKLIYDGWIGVFISPASP